MEFCLLGPLQVVRDGSEIPVNAAKQRILLAVLAMHAGQLVPVHELIDRLWGATPPAGARNTVRAYVMRLRKILGDPSVIETMLDGYRLVGGGTDVQRFDSLLATARTDPDLPLLDEALALWRGDPADGLLPAETQTLAERRLDALTLRCELAVDLGRHDEAIPDLGTLVRQHPLRENLWALLMRALHAAGRQAEALTAYDQARATLADALGIDPGEELRAVHALVTGTAPRRVVSQLPPSVGNFVGRRRELDLLRRQLTSARVAVVCGPPGIGKTSLAVRSAHELKAAFPDGQLFVNLRGFDPSGRPVEPESAMRGFLGPLGVEPSAIPAEQEAQRELYQKLLADKRMLVLLDNAADHAQVVPLLPDSPTCAVLVTSRNRLATVAPAGEADPVQVDVLPDHEAVALLTARLGAERLAAEPDAVTELLDCCAGLPLALSIVAGRAQVETELPLSALAAELRDTATRLSRLDEDPMASMRAVLSWSVATLTDEQARVFGLIGLAPGPDIGPAAVAGLLDRPAATVGEVLPTLESMSLVQQHVPGRYRMHDLVRLYAAELAASRLPAPDRDSALRRLVDFYLHTGRAADKLLDPHRPAIEFGPPMPGCGALSLPDAAAAMAWFDAEHAGIMAVQQLAGELGWHPEVWKLAWTLVIFHARRGTPDSAVAAWTAGLAAADRLDETSVQILAHRMLGYSHARAGRTDEAFRELDDALTLAERTSDLDGQAHTQFAIAWASEHAGDDQRALDHTTKALELFRTLENPVWEAQMLNARGWYAARLGQYDSARESCRAALVINRRLGDRRGEADTLDSLGFIAFRTGRHPQAIDYYEQALALYRSIGHGPSEAIALEWLGQVHAALGDRGRAQAAWQQSVEIFQAKRRHRDADRVQALLDRT